MVSTVATPRCCHHLVNSHTLHHTHTLHTLYITHTLHYTHTHTALHATLYYTTHTLHYTTLYFTHTALHCTTLHTHYTIHTLHYTHTTLHATLHHTHTTHTLHYTHTTCTSGKFRVVSRFPWKSPLKICIRILLTSGWVGDTLLLAHQIAETFFALSFQMEPPFESFYPSSRKYIVLCSVQESSLIIMPRCNNVSV